MSSHESKYNDGDTSSVLFQAMKKRMIQRACDICRRKKIRCDGVQTKGTRCSNCKSYNLDCTYVEDAKKRGTPKSYVENLEKRAERLDKLLRLLCPDEKLYNQFNASLDTNWIIERSPMDPSTLVDEIALQVQVNTPKVGMVTPLIHGAMDNNLNNIRSLTQPHDEDDPSLILDSLKRMSLKAPTDSRFCGKSSEATLAQTAIEMKKEYMGNLGEPEDPEKPAVKHQRLEFWATQSWERESDKTTSPVYTFPELDIALQCIDLYFKHDNLYLPLLHRPTFDKSVQEGLYLTDEEFAPIFLLVCAVGARYSDDPRVLLDDFDSQHSSGWKWFDQVQIMKRSLITPPTLYDLQLYCLCITFLMSSSSPQSCGTLVGVAIHLAQDAGAHRRKAYGQTLTPKEELWKRAFWVLVSLDRMSSLPLGQPCSIQDEDFDLDWPVECDDEYWDNPDPEKCFKQPANKPSLITAFVLYLKLQKILALSLRTIYSINQSKILLGFAKQQWEQDLVAEMDSMLNKWVDSVPDHLRWNPNLHDDNFFDQSVFLYTEYYYIQITIHRPFIPTPRKPSPLSFPSLAICTNAARSCTHIIHTQRMRNNNPPPHPRILMPIFTSAIVLLLGIWDAKRSNLSTDTKKAMSEVHRCMKAVKMMEKWWQPAGMLWDTLYEFTSKGELPLPEPSPPADTGREDKPDTASFASGSDSSWNQNKIPGTIVGSFPSEPTQMKRSPKEQQSAFTMSPNAGSPNFSLPVYSNELGRQPLQSFDSQTRNSQTQTHSSQLHHRENHWYVMPHSVRTEGGERFEPTPFAAPGGASSSYELRHSGTSAPPPQQQQQHPPRPHHALQSIPTDGSSSTSGISMTQNPYGMEMASTSFEPKMEALSHTQLSKTSMGSNSMVAPPLPSSGGSMAENVYSGMMYFQSQEVPRQGELLDPFTVDHDTAEIWSEAPTGFELDKWGAYITEMMQDGHRHPSG